MMQYRDSPEYVRMNGKKIYTIVLIDESGYWYKTQRSNTKKKK